MVRDMFKNADVANVANFQTSPWEFPAKPCMNLSMNSKSYQIIMEYEIVANTQ
jgi:hypothetical protein